ncbi:hypothetical protein [Acidocella facilis]|uniref:hypothetical protein n=1 Tax=Acidocella facilis TaxID=525 RepID=UPI001F1C21F6|nr:hypothetical protein [Acidocella facilis]
MGDEATKKGDGPEMNVSFIKARANPRLSNIKPVAVAHDLPEEAADEVAKQNGFLSREPSQPSAPKAATGNKISRGRSKMGPYVMLNTRMPEPIAKRFYAFCDENRYTYWEAIDALMKKQGV